MSIKTGTLSFRHTNLFSASSLSGQRNKLKKGNVINLYH